MDDLLAGFAAELAARGELLLSLKVTPRAARSGTAGLLAGGTLKVKVAAPPEKGKANDELCAFLARQFGVPKANVRVESGHASPRKRVRVVR